MTKEHFLTNIFNNFLEYTQRFIASLEDMMMSS